MSLIKIDDFYQNGRLASIKSKLNSLKAFVILLWFGERYRDFYLDFDFNQDLDNINAFCFNKTGVYNIVINKRDCNKDRLS